MVIVLGSPRIVDEPSLAHVGRQIRSHRVIAAFNPAAVSVYPVLYLVQQQADIRFLPRHAALVGSHSDASAGTNVNLCLFAFERDRRALGHGCING